jgi:hypothetical protein
MSRITLSGNASGTGNFTLASPNSSTDRTLTLPDATGTVVVSGASPALGGVYLGGTGSANLLDDYEEGTWTPRIADFSTGSTLVSAGDYSGTYTKVGNTVILRCVIGATASLSGGTVAIWDLPFVVADTQSAYAPGACLTRQINLNGGSYIVMEPTKGSAKCAPLIVFSGTSSTTNTVTNGLCGSQITLNFTLTYITT